MSQISSQLGRWIKVQAYKHDGSLHRQWSPAFLVEETDDYWALASRASLVNEADGRKWMTKEKAIFLLYKKKWMNVIAMFKEGRGICYYVNIASPTLFADGYLKYIDYDLDVKLYPDGIERVLDENEYERHTQTYGYPEELSKVVERSKIKVEEMISKGELPFRDEEINRLFDEFVKMNQPIRRKWKGKKRNAEDI